MSHSVAMQRTQISFYKNIALFIRIFLCPSYNHNIFSDKNILTVLNTCPTFHYRMLLHERYLFLGQPHEIIQEHVVSHFFEIIRPRRMRLWFVSLVFLDLHVTSLFKNFRTVTYDNDLKGFCVRNFIFTFISMILIHEWYQCVTVVILVTYC